MLKEIKRHQLAYFLLVVGLILGVVLFLGSWPDRKLQRIVAVGIATFYFLWGALVHLKEKYTYKRIMLEYLGVSVLVSLLLILITF